MDNSVKLFGSVILDRDSIVSINIEESGDLFFANSFKALFFIVMALAWFLVFYFPHEIFNGMSFLKVSIYVFSISIASLVVSSLIIGSIFDVGRKRISISMTNGLKTYSEYIPTSSIDEYIKYTKKLIENSQYSNINFDLENCGVRFEDNDNPSYLRLYLLNKSHIMEFRVAQSIVFNFIGIIKGIDGAACVQIVTFDGKYIKRYNSDLIFVQDAYNVRRKLYEKFNSVDDQLKGSSDAE